MTTVPILCYHAVAEDTDGPVAPWVTAPATFDRHLDALEAAGYHAWTVGELVSRAHDGGESPAGAVVLTFDDGFTDFADVVWPRLEARGWPATLYVTTATVGDAFDGRPTLDHHQLRDLAHRGVEIGAHGHRHLQLDTVDLETARDEIEHSRDLLEHWIGRAVTTFAYPHGYHDRRTRDLVVQAGFWSACAVKQSLSSTEDDRFALARLMPQGDVTAEELLARITDPATPVAHGQRERPVTTAWRCVRKARAKLGRRAGQGPGPHRDEASAEEPTSMTRSWAA